MKSPKNSIPRLYEAAREIVEETRAVFARQGRDAREVRLPILMQGTDMRVTIEAGPTIVARNALELAQMKASGKPVEPVVDMSKALKEAQMLLDLFASDLAASNLHAEQGSAEWHRAKDTADRCMATARALKEVERLL